VGGAAAAGTGVQTQPKTNSIAVMKNLFRMFGPLPHWSDEPDASIDDKGSLVYRP